MAEDAEFVALYASELADLTFNSKPAINTLTMLAAENARAAPSIAAAIERHVATCPPKHKLPALYLVDSIAKNVGQPFIALFAKNLPQARERAVQVYVTVWQAAPETRNALEKLRATWHGVFADAVLASVARASQARLAAIAAVIAAALPAPQTLPAPYMAPSWQQPAALEPAAYPAYSQPLVYAQPQAYQQALPQQPQPVPYQGYQAAPVSPGHYGPPQSPGYAPAPANGAYNGAPGAQPGVYAPLQPAPQQQPMLLAPQPAPAPVQYVAQQPQPQPQIVYQAQQPAPLPAPAQLPAPQPLPAPVQLPTPVTLPAPVNVPLPAPVTLPAPGPAPAGRRVPRGAPQGGPGSSAPVLPDFLTSLLQQGLIRVQGGEGGAAAGVGAAGGGADGAGESDDEGVPRRRYDPQKLQFLAERIKVADPAAVAELQRVSAQTRSSRLDRAYLHRRRVRGQGGKGSRAWYVDEAAWLAGTTADATAAPKFFQEEEAEAEAARAPEPSVPADDDQPACALSGERFDTFWDDAEGQWCFRGAVRLDAEQAARYGLEEGALVKASCLGPATGASGAAPEVATLGAVPPPAAGAHPAQAAAAGAPGAAQALPAVGSAAAVTALVVSGAQPAGGAQEVPTAGLADSGSPEELGATADGGIIQAAGLGAGGSVDDMGADAEVSLGLGLGSVATAEAADAAGAARGSEPGLEAGLRSGLHATDETVEAVDSALADGAAAVAGAGAGPGSEPLVASLAAPIKAEPGMATVAAMAGAATDRPLVKTELAEGPPAGPAAGADAATVHAGCTGLAGALEGSAVADPAELDISSQETLGATAAAQSSVAPLVKVEACASEAGGPSATPAPMEGPAQASAGESLSGQKRQLEEGAAPGVGNTKRPRP